MSAQARVEQNDVDGSRSPSHSAVLMGPPTNLNLQRRSDTRLAHSNLTTPEVSVDSDPIRVRIDECFRCYENWTDARRKWQDLDTKCQKLSGYRNRAILEESRNRWENLDSERRKAARQTEERRKSLGDAVEVLLRTVSSSILSSNESDNKVPFRSSSPQVAASNSDSEVASAQGKPTTAMPCVEATTHENGEERGVSSAVADLSRSKGNVALSSGFLNELAELLDISPHDARARLLVIAKRSISAHAALDEAAPLTCKTTMMDLAAREFASTLPTQVQETQQNVSDVAFPQANSKNDARADFKRMEGQGSSSIASESDTICSESLARCYIANRNPKEDPSISRQEEQASLQNLQETVRIQATKMMEYEHALNLLLANMHTMSATMAGHDNLIQHHTAVLTNHVVALSRHEEHLVSNAYTTALIPNPVSITFEEHLSLP